MKQLSTLAVLLLPSALFAQTLDPTFNGTGIVQTEVELPSIGNAIAIQSNGRILVAGNADSTSTIVRYMPDGSLDASFGTNGVVVFAPVAGPGGREFTITEITVLSTGKILVAGRATYYLTTELQQIYVARFNSNGTVDTTFGGNGTGRLSISLSSVEQGYGWKLLIQPDGKILFQGTRTAASTGSLTYRLLANGTYDSSFGSGGEVLFGWVVYSHTYGRSIALQADGKVLVGGWLATPTESDRFVRRLTPQGELDPSYGVDGIAFFNEGDGYSEIVSDILLQNDGKLLMVGSVSTATEQRIRVTRLLEDGSIDTSYGTNGELIGPVVSGGTITPQRGCLQSDGKLIFVTNVNNGSTNHSTIWRVNTNGTLDTSFGSNGQLTDPCGAGSNLLMDMAQQVDGKLIICGQGPGGAMLTAARLSSDPVGVEELRNTPSIRLAPNPNDGHFILHTGEFMLYRVEITDMQGRLVRHMDHLQGDTPVDVSDIPAGTYTLRAITSGKVTNLPFIIH